MEERELASAIRDATKLDRDKNIALSTPIERKQKQTALASLPDHPRVTNAIDRRRRNPVRQSCIWGYDGAKGEHFSPGHATALSNQRSIPRSAPPSAH